MVHEVLRFWDGLWTARYISPTTVNFVDDPANPHAFHLMILLYILMTAIFFSVFIIRRRWTMTAAAQTFVLCSVIAALFFALVTDYRWFKQWRADRQALARLSVDERIAYLNRGWDGEFALARGLRQFIPAGETVRLYAGASFQKSKFGYYLLPVKLSAKGKYALVYRDESVLYDPSSSVLRKGDEILETPMSLVAYTADGAFLLKEVEREGSKSP